MRNKTLFRLMLKAIGVWIAATAIGSLSGSLLFYFGSFFLNRPGQVTMAQGFPLYLATPLVQVCIGAYLFFGGKRIVDLAIPSNRPYCHECGYDLTGAVGDICNECGTPFRGATPGNS
jgi:hypothetical protein